jgi:hypothetical protein
LLKATLIAIAIAGLISLGVLGPQWLMSDSDTSAQFEDTVECEVLQHTCRWTHQGNQWEADLTRVDSVAGNTEYRLSVKTDVNQTRLLAVLRGESMYLGEYPVPMSRTEVAEDDDKYIWDTQFTAPFCTTDPEMTWRIDLQKGVDEKADQSIKLIFSAEART